MVDKLDNKIYLSEIEELSKNDKIKTCSHVSQFSDTEIYLNPCYGDPTERTVYQGGFLSDEGFLNPKTTVYHDDTGLKFIKSGPRKSISFDPKKVTAAILTCGGICPGLNVVIRELYMTLRYNYQVDKIYGIKNGYQGIYTDTDKTYITLENNLVKDIHKYGGTILGSSRGGFDLDKIIQSLIDKKIDMLFVIGGDGTHRGIQKIAEECIRRSLKIVVCGIPKTIDNDIPIIDRTFGFETAVEQAVKVIECANVEANSAINGIGIVKLFGRSCGFISLYAALASRDVNICLIPESEFELYGEKGLLDFVITRVKERGHCLIVVAEGCGSAIKDLDIGDTGILDKSGNKKLIVSFSLINLFFIIRMLV
jgi:6-phosphofructokinase 1